MDNVGHISGTASHFGRLSGQLSVPSLSILDIKVYDGDYTVIPANEAQILKTENTLLKKNITVERNTIVLPEGSELSEPGDVDAIIDDVFGEDPTPDPDTPTYDADDIATPQEFDSVLTDVFGK